MDKKKAVLLLADGFEEAEAIIVADVLRRNEIEVTIAAVSESRELVGLWGIRVIADELFASVCARDYDAVLLPGGPKSARYLGESPTVLDFVGRHIGQGKYICCLCSAGAHVLARNKLLGSRIYTCSGDNHTLYEDGSYVNRPVVRDGLFITGKGLGHAFEFAFCVSELLVDAERCKEQADHIYVSYDAPAEC